MPNWKKVIVSGSDAALNSVTTPNGTLNSFSASYALTASYALNGGTGGGGISAIYIADEGTVQGTASYFDFNGAGVTATVTNNTASITIAGGGGGGDTNSSNAILNQTVAAVTWSFDHNLATQYPVFTIYDANDDVIIPQKIHTVTTSSALIYFSSARTGTAVASKGGNVVTASAATSASYALRATSASYAATATSASYAANSTTSSYSLYAAQAGYASTSGTADSATSASYAESATSASYTSIATSASYALTASYWSGSILNATSASYALSASYSNTSISASYAANSTSASYALNGGVTQLLAGPNITLSPTTGKGQVTISATGDGGPFFNTATGSYGSFYDTTTQTNPVANVPRSMSFNTTDISNGVSISGSSSPFNTYIKTQNPGVYNIQFSAQLDKTDSGTDEVVIWIRKNGINLTDTATTITLTNNNTKYVAAWNWFVNAAADDYYQIIWYSADTDLRILAETAGGGHPGIPSVILTANRVDQFLSNTGSFSGSFTGELLGTSSYAVNSNTASYSLVATSASYALNATTASYAINATTAQTASYANNFTVAGTLTAQTINVQTVSSSVVYSSGSNRFGNDLTNTQSITGSASITGSLQVNGSNVILSNQTSSMSVATASYVQNAQTASYVLQAVSASYATSALTASHALTAPYSGLQGTVPTWNQNTTGTAATASYVLQAVSASYATNALSASYWSGSILNATSASYAATASYALNVPETASYALTALTASYAANVPLTASYALSANTASYALTASYISGSGAGVGFPFSGSAVITGSLFVSSSFISGSFTGSLEGTASYATFALSASNAPGFTTNKTQSTPAVTWSFVHNLNTRNPLIQVYDASYNQVIPNAIVATDALTATIYFDYSASGYAVASNGGGLYITGSTSRLDQTSAAVTWSFTHNLNTKYPAFEVYDSSDLIVIPSGIRAINENSAEIYFATPSTGKAIANFSGINGAPNATTASYSVTSEWNGLNAKPISSSLGTAAAASTTVVAQTATASYSAAFFDYAVISGSNSRAGTVMSVWNGGSVEYTDTSTSDIGNTDQVTMSVDLSGANVRLKSTTTDAWTVKSLIRLI